MNAVQTRAVAADWKIKTLLFLLFTGIGWLVYSVFSPLDPMLPKTQDFWGRLTLAAVLLAASLLLRRSERLHQYWLLIFGLFIMITAVSLDWYIGSYWVTSGMINPNTAMGSALQKISELVVIGLTILLLTRVSGGSLGSIYLQKGNLKLGLIIGAATFVAAALLAIPIANYMFMGKDLTIAKILPWAHWVVIFVLANGAMEELLFRGLFLRKLEPFFGKFTSNLMVALVFVALHGVATYSSDRYFFLAVTFPLALLWGYIMQKTDGIWGSILFHAGMDISIILGIFSNY